MLARQCLEIAPITRLPNSVEVNPSLSINSQALQPVLHLDALGNDRFAANTLSPNMGGAIFGGQYLANVVGAAMLTADAHHPHMMQAFFLRAGDLQSPLEYSVQRVREGRRFAHRRVEVHQQERLLMTADVSLYTGGNAGHHHQRTMPVLPPPEQLDTLEVLLKRHRTEISADIRERVLRKQAVLVKPVDPTASIFHKAKQAQLAIWLKTAQTMPATRYYRYCALTYLADYWLGAVSTALYADSIFSPAHAVLSLNHSLWFHTEPMLDDWLLYALDSPNAGRGLGLGHGAFYDRRGTLLATAMQEALQL